MPGSQSPPLCPGVLLEILEPMKAFHTRPQTQTKPGIRGTLGNILIPRPNIMAPLALPFLLVVDLMINTCGLFSM